MHVQLQIIGEDYELLKKSGLIDKQKIDCMVDLAKKLNFYCLKYVDSEQPTFFSQQHFETLKNELEILKKHPEVDGNLIDLLEAYSYKIFRVDYIYLKFVPIK